MFRKKKVLFLCTYNSVRSQMAEALLKHLAKDKFEVKSAGAHPSGINPNVEEVLSEIGVSIEGQYSKNVDKLKDEKFDYVITLCDSAKSTCPVFNGQYTKIHWSIKDPGETQGSLKDILSAFRCARDILKERILGFIEEVSS